MSDPTSRVIVMCGLPFSGKTDFALDCFNDVFPIHSLEDLIYTQNHGTKTVLDNASFPHLIKRVTPILYRDIEDSIQDHQDCVVEAYLYTTRSRIDFCRDVNEIARRHRKNIEIHAVEMPKLTLSNYAQCVVDSRLHFSVGDLLNKFAVYTSPSTSEGFKTVSCADDSDKLWTTIYS